MNDLASSTTSSSPNRRALLLSGNALTRKVLIAMGAVLARGSVIGAVLGNAVAAAAVGNTGNGAIGAITLGAGVKRGVYNIVFVEPVANAGAFVVEDPDGVLAGRGNVAAAFAGPIGFTIADGAADYVAGDRILVTVALDDDEVHALAAAAAVDGSQTPVGILVEDVDATAADTETLMYIRGDFDVGALTFGAGHTADTVAAELRKYGIYLIPSASAPI